MTDTHSIASSRFRLALFLIQHRSRNGVDPEEIMKLNMNTPDEAVLLASDIEAALAAITELRAENARLHKNVAMMNEIMVGEIMSEEAVKHG